MVCNECKTIYKVHGEHLYPHYGMAPHNHNFMKTGTFIGSTEIKPMDDWPANFVEDPEAAGCGVYYCPDEKCERSKTFY